MTELYLFFAVSAVLLLLALFLPSGQKPRKKRVLPKIMKKYEYKGMNEPEAAYKSARLIVIVYFLSRLFERFVG